MSKKNEHNCETWLMTLKGCHASRRQKQWAIGDAIVAAKREWKAWHGASARLYDLWQRAAEATGHPEDSLFQYARVAEVFPPKTRVFDLSFSCYQTIAGISDEKQRMSLCKRAEKKHLSCDAVRLMIQKIQNKEFKSSQKKLSLKISVDAYSKLRDRAVAQNTTAQKFAVELLSA